MSSFNLTKVGRGPLYAAMAIGAALALLPGPALASHSGHSSSSTHSGGGVHSSGHASGHSSYGHSSSGRSGGSHGWSAENGRVGVPRTGGGPGPRQPHGSRGDHHGGVIVGGWPWWGGGWGWGPSWDLGWGFGWGWNGWWPGYGGYYGGYPYGGYPYGGYPYGGYYGSPYGGYYGGPGYYGRDSRYGALDLDVSPEDAQVYVDGELAGICDDFDGYPSYLWLPAGTHDIVIYHPGYLTISRQYTVRPGDIVEVGDHMQNGQAVLPQDLQTQSHARRDERLRRDAEREAEAEQRPPGWRDRGDAGREQEGLPPLGNPGAPPSGYDQRPAGRDQATVHLRVSPVDASVYLDGTFIGSAAQVTTGRGMVVPPGNHRIEVVRPGYKASHADFRCAPGEDVELKVDLDEQ